jgi:hypothetical protein
MLLNEVEGAVGSQGYPLDEIVLTMDGLQGRPQYVEPPAHSNNGTGFPIYPITVWTMSTSALAYSIGLPKGRSVALPVTGLTWPIPTFLPPVSCRCRGRRLAAT